MAGVIGIAKFRVRPDRVEEMRSSYGEAFAALRRVFPGLRAAELIHLDGDCWADVVHWDSLETVRAACERAMSVPEFARWCENLLEDVSMEHGEIASALAA